MGGTCALVGVTGGDFSGEDSPKIKIQQVKNLFFPSPSNQVIPVSPPYLPISFMLFLVCLSCYIVLSTFLNLNAYVIDCHGKNWLKALTNLMHNLLLLHLISMNHCD